VAAGQAPAVHRQRDAGAVGFERGRVGAEAQAHAVAFEHGADHLRGLVVLARQQARAVLDHGHLAAEARIHLGVFQRDVAGAQDHEADRQFL